MFVLTIIEDKLKTIPEHFNRNSEEVKKLNLKFHPFLLTYVTIFANIGSGRTDREKVC